MLHSIYDLTTFCRKTSGDVPSKLVGASTTVVGRKMYLFGGRLVSERRIVADMYAFDMESFTWERILAHPEDHIPRHRYFHSTDAWNNHLVVFGGMTNQPDSQNPDDLCVLNDVHFFDLATRRWVSAPALQQSPEANIPRARYAHLSAVTTDKLFIIGGQDFYNTWLDDICVFDLQSRTWIQRRDYPRHCGTYRSIAVASTMTVRSPQDDPRTLTHSGSRFKIMKNDTSVDLEPTPSESLIHLPYSAPSSEDHPCDIYLYSNYNFTDVKRELEVFSPLPEADFSIRDQSSAMTGSTFPPGLRFPNGAILGTSLIIAGTYLAHSYQSFSIWALDLVNMTWSRIDPGKALEAGSWFRACLWPDANKFLVFGNRNGNLVEDYNRRLLSWDHVAVVDLEAFGIYQPPSLKLDLRMQEFGLAALEEQIMSDFEFVCDDGRRVPCSRKLLEDRWPWFKEQRLRMLQKALSTSEVLPTSSMHTPLPTIPGTASSITNGPESLVPDPRLTPRAFQLSEPFPITLAFLQYFYAQALITPLQHAPAVLSQLLVLSTVYGLPHLELLVRHAMHRVLSNSTSVAVYEVATLCGCRSLQIRALKTVMSYTQKKPVKHRGEGGSGSGGGGGGGDGGKPGGGGSGNDSDTFTSRPRGTSDAKWRTGETSTRADGGRPSGASQTERVVPVSFTAGSEPLGRSASDTAATRRGPRHQRNAHSADSVQSDVTDSLKYISVATGSSRPVKHLNELPTHSRSSSTSTDQTTSDYGEPLQSGSSLSGFQTRSRAQSVSSKLATVAEQDNGPEQTREQSEQRGKIKTRPRAQSAAGQLLRQFPAPPVPLRTMASMNQLPQRHGLDGFAPNMGNTSRSVPQMNIRSPITPSIVVKDAILDSGPPEIREPVDLGNWTSNLHSMEDVLQSPYSHPFTTSNRISASSYSTSTPSILHTPSDSLSGTPLEIINEQSRPLIGEPRITHGPSTLYDDIDVTTKQGMKRPSLKGLRQLTMDNIPLGTLGTQALTPTSASASTSHSPITPSSSQSSFQRLLSKVSLGKDSNKDGAPTSDSAKRKKRDEAFGLSSFSLI